MKKNLIFPILLILFSFNLNAQNTPSAPSDNEGNSSIVILFRHGETVPPPYVDNPPNPKLSDIGLERAKLIASMLRNFKPDRIYSTNLNRTKETADPLRESLGMEYTFYGLEDMKNMAEEMKSKPGTYVVSGHSNTTPDMVRLLGADPGEPINESEYDRMYIVTIMNGQASSVMIRYGNPYVKK